MHTRTKIPITGLFRVKGTRSSRMFNRSKCSQNKVRSFPGHCLTFRCPAIHSCRGSCRPFTAICSKPIAADCTYDAAAAANLQRVVCLLQDETNFLTTDNRGRNGIYSVPVGKNPVLRDVAPCGFIIDRRFGGMYRPYLQGVRNNASEGTCLRTVVSLLATLKHFSSLVLILLP
jgi:hypothetical protein